MSDSNPSVTVVKERSSIGAIFLGVLAAIVIVVGLLYMLSAPRVTNSSDASVSAAADKVGAAADQVGDAAQDGVTRNR
jgi:glucose uptake protein GlcU